MFRKWEVYKVKCKDMIFWNLNIKDIEKKGENCKVKFGE